MNHKCHARGCSTPVKPELLMCYRHWMRVPRTIQRTVWDSYRPGQCSDKRPSRSWLDAADAAIGYVAVLEKKSCTKAEARALIAFGYEQMLIDIFDDDESREAARRIIAEFEKRKQRVHLGMFESEQAAARAYNAAARKHFGEFARLNFPEPDEQSALRKVE